ncbi:MAG: hypothetical protein ACK4ON_07875 [Bacteroidia bacterium]
MKTACLLAGLFLIVHSLTGQIRAVTEKGDTLLIYRDGTWEYLDEDQQLMPTEVSYSLDTIRQLFTVLPSSAKALRSELDFFNIKYNPEVWERVPEGTINEDAEFAFKAKLGDVYGLVISEEAGFDAEGLFQIAMENMKESVDELKVLSADVRKVNGKDCISAVVKTKTKGLPLIFHSYYFSGEKGSIQFTTWTVENLYAKYQNMILELLNGLVID